ncbi:D-cysteine desulfhydrase family protein [Parapusillimonas granuli]|uniref:D-cysteine desulfhydrase family protein n=1 Tax=Parapusillimonas granuli TaxID=380911 RepID=A0A853G332_9BURK|nr:D-cysteine desulfhydrase family protein [Parapusillimonas granuli]MBB5214686.1 D-cysteine desulfhydrase/L-cysteate sulfo-lyase [Parapusillimonas granuli]NYT48906.1 D-cysteine desulfhydrase family protein [Parapusillimonas granuli]
MQETIPISLPRYRLALTPTPVEPLPNLSSTFGVDLSVKRDDLTGLAFGGNKIRQLEYYFGEAKTQGATLVLITGAVQSNYVRATAAVAARAGMRFHAQLEERVQGMETESYRKSGNILLNLLYDAKISHYPDGDDEAGADAALRDIAADYRRQGETPYIIPLTPDSPSLGSVGYLHAAEELLSQCPSADHFVLASGSGQTQAGLLFGLRMLGSDARVTGICVRRAANEQRKRVASHCRGLAEILRVESPVSSADIVVDDIALGSYGRAEAHVLNAIELAARSDGLILDPVYTGKAFAGLLALLGDGTVARGDNVVFIHTGGTPALFAYGPEILKHLQHEHQ